MKFYFLAISNCLLLAMLCFSQQPSELTTVELQSVVGGECYDDGTVECHEPPTNNCANILCDNEGSESHPAWKCPTGSREPSNKRTGFDGCVPTENGEYADSTSSNNPRWCWKYRLCKKDCHEAADDKWYCNLGIQGGEIDCNRDGSCLDEPICVGEDEDCPPGPGGNIEEPL